MAIGRRTNGVGHSSLEPRRANNVILLIGDGMGKAHRDAGRLLAVGPFGALVMDTFPYAGMVCTSCADPEASVTDSAAAATALATGVKTYNGAIGVGLDGRPLPTVLELAKAVGKAVGLVTTCQVTDATPAAFAAHVEHRSDQSEIARQFIEETGVDIILGGGEDFWYPAGTPGAFPDEVTAEIDERSRGTRGDLVARARALGYAYATTAAELGAARGPRLLGLFANQELFRQKPEGAGDCYEPTVSLEQMTRKAIETLRRNPNGFFLMVEEAAIDRMAHQNNIPLALKGVRELDKAAAVAQAFAAREPDTLVIVTADHETGGLVFAGAVAAGDLRAALSWTTTGHTTADVPLNALGPSGERLTGCYENTHIFDVAVDAMRLAPRVRR